MKKTTQLQIVLEHIFCAGGIPGFSHIISVPHTPWLP
jgi:hypothetical protein